MRGGQLLVGGAHPGSRAHLAPSGRSQYTGVLRPDGEIGRRNGLKIRWPKGHAGSTPARGTTLASFTAPNVQAPAHTRCRLARGGHAIRIAAAARTRSFPPF